MHTVPHEQVLPFLATPIASRSVIHAEDLPVHTHAFMEIAIVCEGTATHTSSAGSRPIERGSLILVRAGEWHGYEDCRDLMVIDVYVGLELFAHELAWITADPSMGVLLNHTYSERLGQAGEQATLDPESFARVEAWCAALASSDRRAVQDRATRIGHLVLILGEVAAALFPQGKGSYLPATAHPSVLRAVRLMEEELALPWTLEALAREVSLAPAYLVRLFSKHLGMPPIAYLNRIRAERVSALLIETDLSVAAIGAQVGWTDPTYVSRRFKACFAMSPARYRAAFRARSVRQ
ncbi:AraC family transcriptional regulator [Streptomyces sp. NPDC004542]|uniref:helix-turn-helix transcriptional regulator n=1 Tax=Streptomyces sp. NPDC004542 TaxID=3154281 RepID=UPI0033A0FAE1